MKSNFRIKWRLAPDKPDNYANHLIIARFSAIQPSRCSFRMVNEAEFRNLFERNDKISFCFLNSIELDWRNVKDIPNFTRHATILRKSLNDGADIVNKYAVQYLLDGSYQNKYHLSNEEMTTRKFFIIKP